jgi:hypothetical protein
MRAAGIVAHWLAATLIAMTGSAVSGQEYNPSPAAKPKPPTEGVYLIKGLAGFQTGVVELGAKLQKRGINPRIESHADSTAVSDAIAKRYKSGIHAPIVLVGYSLGADAIASMARELNAQKVPVALLISFAPMYDQPIPGNVRRAINYYQSTSAWRGKYVPGNGFHGALTNINLDKDASINHFNIISLDRFQLDTIAKISALVGASRKPAPPKTATQASGQPTTQATPMTGEPVPARSN